MVRQRYHFIHHDLPYSIDIYDNLLGEEKTYILRFANPNSQDPASLVPDFLFAIQDVRRDSRYSLREIALKK